ncbi:MAG: hypothetical protein ACSLE5_02310, partial [Porticoccaceae bacterium]
EAWRRCSHQLVMRQLSKASLNTIFCDRLQFFASQAGDSRVAAQRAIYTLAGVYLIQKSVHNTGLVKLTICFI